MQTFRVERRDRHTRAVGTNKQRNASNGTQDPVLNPLAPCLSVFNYVPQSVHVAETYQQTVKWHNTSNNPATAVEFRFAVPTGAQFISLTTDPRFANLSPGAEKANFVFAGRLDPHGDATFTFVLCASMPLDGKIVNNSSTFGGTYARGFNLLPNDIAGLSARSTNERTPRATQAMANQQGVISTDRSRAAALGTDGTFTFGATASRRNESFAFSPDGDQTPVGRR